MDLLHKHEKSHRVLINGSTYSGDCHNNNKAILVHYYSTVLGWYMEVMEVVQRRAPSCTRLNLSRT